MRLAKRKIDALIYQGRIADGKASRYVAWDDEVKGFGVRVFPSGAKTFVLSYRHQGIKRLLTIGDFGVLTIEEARDRARKALVDVLDGADPLAEKRKERQGETMADLCRMYLERHASQKKSGKEDVRKIERRILPRWGNVKVKAIQRADVAKLHFELGQSAPYEANRLLALLRKMFNLAQAWGMVEEGRNPATRIPMHKEVKRDRWVTPAELPKLAQAIDQEENIYARYALWLYLLTGARKSEILQARWDDIDEDRRELRIPDTKAGRTHYIPLSEAALAVLANIPRELDNPHILPGSGATGHMINIHKAWDRVRKAAGVEDVRLHDLRRTVGSWLAQRGNSLHLIGKVLNHSNPSTTAVYARFAQDQVRQALEDHGKQILGIAGRAPTADVVDIKGRK